MNKSVSRVESTVEKPVRRHIAVLGRGYVACRDMAECFGRNHRIAAELFYSSRSDFAEIIISVTHFGILCNS